MNLKQTKALLAKFRIQPTHSLGQNFLIDDVIVAEICDLAAVTPQDCVLEIGPGLGHLTVELARRTDQVIAIEIDQHILPALSHALEAYPNVTVIHADALKTDLRAVLADRIDPDSTQPLGSIDLALKSHQVKVVANLPYYVTTDLLLKLMLDVPNCFGLWLMMQKEAIDRIAAEPNTREYSPVGVIARSLGRMKQTLEVTRDSFYPQPHVDSAILELILFEPAERIIQPEDLSGYADFVQSCFRQRRKTLVNSFTPTKRLNAAFSKGLKLADLLESHGLRRDIRAEAVTPAQFVKLYYSIIEFSKSI